MLPLPQGFDVGLQTCENWVFSPRQPLRESLPAPGSPPQPASQPASQPGRSGRGCLQRSGLPLAPPRSTAAPAASSRHCRHRALPSAARPAFATGSSRGRRRRGRIASRPAVISGAGFSPAELLLQPRGHHHHKEITRLPWAGYFYRTGKNVFVTVK